MTHNVNTNDLMQYYGLYLFKEVDWGDYNKVKVIIFILCWIIVTEHCCLKFLEGSRTGRLKIDYQLIKTQYNSFVIVTCKQCNVKPSEHSKLKPLKRFHSNRRLNFLFNSMEKRILWCFLIKERSQTENSRK